MVVNVRGTGGSGKSTIVRHIMAHYECVPQFAKGRKQPRGYLCAKEGHRPLYVVGHYETPCGGGDTITSMREVFADVRTAAQAGHDVIFEGIISQDDVTRTAALHLDFPGQLKVIGLRVPIEHCLTAIRERRAERGDDRPLNPKNTTNRAKSLEKTMTRLRDAGIEAVWCDRETGAAMARAAFDL